MVVEQLALAGTDTGCGAHAVWWRGNCEEINALENDSKASVRTQARKTLSALLGQGQSPSVGKATSTTISAAVVDAPELLSFDEDVAAGSGQGLFDGMQVNSDLGSPVTPPAAPPSGAQSAGNMLDFLELEVVPDTASQGPSVSIGSVVAPAAGVESESKLLELSTVPLVAPTQELSGFNFIGSPQSSSPSAPTNGVPCGMGMGMGMTIGMQGGMGNQSSMGMGMGMGMTTGMQGGMGNQSSMGMGMGIGMGTSSVSQGGESIGASAFNFIRSTDNGKAPSVASSMESGDTGKKTAGDSDSFGFVMDEMRKR
jgi:hypothetical protein